MTDKLISASKLEALTRVIVIDDKSVANNTNGDFIIYDDVRALIAAAPEVSSEPVGVVAFDAIGEQQATVIKWIGNYQPKQGDKIYTTPQDQTALIRELSDTLERAQNGLRWYQDEHPEDGSEADGELHEEIDALLTRAKEAI